MTAAEWIAEKCKFMQLSVKYLGYHIDASGDHATM